MLLDASHLEKSYDGTPAVVDVSFQVGAGEVFGLLGPNGAGKTTTMMMLAGLLRPDAGSVRIDDRLLDSANRELRMLFGVVPQDLAVYPDLTAGENLVFFSRLYGLRGRELKQRVQDTLESTGLTERAADRVATFSGGMKRRLNFGIALLHRPRLLILDEPTVGVDPQSRLHLLDCVRQLSREGIGVLYASHYMEEVQAICHRVGIMDHGRMLACDTLGALLGRLQSDLCVRVAPASERLAERLRGLAEVRQSSPEEAVLTVVRDPQSNGDVPTGPLVQVFDIVRECGARVCSVDTQEPNLERLFLELTGARLRD